MSEKLKKIIEKVKKNNIKGTLKINFKLKDYLSVDADGVTFLEHLLRNDIQISYHDQNKYENSIDMAYIYALCNKSLWFFKLNEDVLFSLKDGERYIDIFAKKDLITSSVIKNIKKHIEIIDLIISNYSYPVKLMYLNKKIIHKLLNKDENGMYIIEKYISNSNAMEYIVPLIDDGEKLIEICNKNNNFDFMKFCNEDVLMHNISKNKTILEDLLSKNIIPKQIKYIPNNVKFINILREKKLYEILTTANEDIMLMNVDSGKTLLEEIVENGYKPKLKYIENAKILEILYKNNMLDIDFSVSNRLLLKPVDNVFNDSSLGENTLLEYFVDNGYDLKLNKHEKNFDDIVTILVSKEYYDLLLNTLGNEVFDKGALLMDKLISKNRIDLLVKSPMKFLLRPIKTNGSELYLDYVLRAIKDKKIKYNLEYFALYTLSCEELAKFILTVAKHDMMIYLKELNEEELLKEKNNTTLLEQLLLLDSDLTVNKVLSDDIKSDFKIATILNDHGIEYKNIKLPVQEEQLTDNTIEDFNSTLGIGPMLFDGDILLNKVKELFYNDGKSDKRLVKTLINGYRNALLENYKLSIKELRLLIRIKEENMDKFVYIKEKEGAHFKPITGAVYIDDEVVSTILHETGHALHFYKANELIPDDYKKIIEMSQKNPDILKRVDQYSSKLHRVYDEVEKVVNEKMKSYIAKEFTPDKKIIIDEFLNDDLEQKLLGVKELGINQEALKTLLSESFTVEEYIKQQERIFKKENLDVILRNEYGSFIAIGDILDAIYEGDLHAGILKNTYGQIIKKTYGHGIAYYCNTDKGFKEMIANFSTIVKSKDSQKNLDLLKNIVGDEVFNMISNFYYNNFINSEEKQIEEGKSL